MGNRHAVAVTACSQPSAQNLDMQDKTTACRDCPQSYTSYLKHYAAAAQLHSMGMYPCTACSSSQKSTRGARSIARKQDLLETDSSLHTHDGSSCCMRAQKQITPLTLPTLMSVQLWTWPMHMKVHGLCLTMSYPNTFEPPRHLTHSPRGTCV